MALVVKTLPVNAETTGDWGPIPGSEDLLEQEMATHSNMLAGITPLIEEPGRLQFMQLQRVKHDWVTAHVCRC